MLNLKKKEKDYKRSTVHQKLLCGNTGCLVVLLLDEGQFSCGKLKILSKFLLKFLLKIILEIKKKKQKNKNQKNFHDNL